MTKREAKKALRDAAEDKQWDDGELREIFAALYGRAPDDDEDADLVSLCYAAL